MPTPGNAINEATTGITGFTGTAFTGTAVTQYNVITGGSTSSTLNNVAPSATSGVPVISQGSSSQPVFGTAVVAGGGTGATSLTGIVLGNGTSAMTTITYTAVTSWTPNIQINASSTGITYTTQLGYYSQVGSMVFITYYITLSSKGASTGAVTISNLPVTSGANGGVNTISTATFSGVTLIGLGQIGTSVSANSTILNFYTNGTALATANLTNTQISNTFSVTASGFYFIN